MTNNQLFLSMAGLMVTVVTAQSMVMKWYVDARFEAVNARLTAIETQLKFLVDHMVDHAERIARLEAKLDVRG
jgi:hypothetical protein